VNVNRRYVRSFQEIAFVGGAVQTWAICAAGGRSGQRYVPHAGDFPAA
jgi:hypothetical protein